MPYIISAAFDPRKPMTSRQRSSRRNVWDLRVGNTYLRPGLDITMTDKQFAESKREIDALLADELIKILIVGEPQAAKEAPKAVPPPPPPPPPPAPVVVEAAQPEPAPEPAPEPVPEPTPELEVETPSEPTIAKKKHRRG